MKKIVCLGDSITYGYDSSVKINEIKQVDKPYPLCLNELLGTEYKVYNSGNVGWQARQTVKHLEELVFKYQPELCLVMLGINDSRGSHKGLMVSKQNYINNMQEIVDRLLAQKIKVVIVSPTPIVFFRGKKFYQYSAEIAQKNELPFIDLYKFIADELDLDGFELKDILDDNVHLTQEYYIKIANYIYEQLKSEGLV